VANLAVYVTPKAGRDELAGWRGSELAVRVSCAPEGGKANAAVCKVVSGVLGVPKSAVRVVRGETARHKVLAIDGVDEAQMRAILGEPGETLF
jgi:uncharacterized protein